VNATTTPTPTTAIPIRLTVERSPVPTPPADVVVEDVGRIVFEPLAEAEVEEVVLAVRVEDVEVPLVVVLLVVVELLVVVVVLLIVLVVLLVVLVVLIVVVAEVELVEVVIATGEYVNVVVFQTGFVLIELDHEALTV